jgi:hypothetical protein
LTEFYGVLDAGRSRYITRNGDRTNGVRVAAVISQDRVLGPDTPGRAAAYVETTMDDQGRWMVSVGPSPDEGGEFRVVARGWSRDCVAFPAVSTWTDAEVVQGMNELRAELERRIARSGPPPGRSRSVTAEALSMVEGGLAYLSPRDPSSEGGA